MISFVIVSGIVRNLHVTKGREDLMITKPNKFFTETAAVYAALTGNNASASILSTSSRGSEIDMEFFVCEVQNIQLSGRFYRVEFKEGERIDFIAVLKERFGEVQCARNERQRLIWTLPYQNRGHIAQKRNDIFYSVIISSLISIVFTGMTFYNSSLSLHERLIEMAWLAVPLFFISIFVNYMARRPFYKFSFNATEIFRIFKFKNPEIVNLPKYNREAQNEYVKEFGNNNMNHEPWKYRYKKSDLII